MQCLFRRAPTFATSSLLHPSRFLSSTHPILQKSMPSRPKPPPDSDLEESYLKGSGPGGQKINKTNSAVQIKHVPTGIVVKSQATRSRAQNRKHAREILAQRLDDLQHGEQSRAGIVGAVRKKRADSKAKKSRRKYKKLKEEKGAAEDVVVEQGEEADAASRESTGGDAGQRSSQTAAEKTSAVVAEDKGNSSQTSSDASPSQSINSTAGQ